MALTKTIKAESVWDVNARTEQSIEAVFQLALDNGLSFDAAITPGTQVEWSGKKQELPAKAVKVQDVDQRPRTTTNGIMGQTVWDIALQEYGSLEGVMDLLRLNADLGPDRAVGGGPIKVQGSVAGVEVFYHLQGKQVKPISGSYNVGDFNNDFNPDYY